MERTVLLFCLSFLLLACGGSSSNEHQTPASSDGSRAKDQAAPKSPNENGKGIIRCFAYHRFGNDTYPSTNISLDRFEAHLQFLNKNDYQVLTLGKALERMRKGGIKGKTAVLTMDDGYASIMSGAVPLLKEYGYPATIFVCTEYVGGKNNLSWEELEQLQKKGYEIGNHSHSHAHFLNASSDSIEPRFKKDLDRSEERFKKHLGEKPDLYAYPYGEYLPALERVLEKRGYKGAVAQRSGVIGPKSDPFALPRFPMTSFYGKPEKFAEKARMHHFPIIKEEPASPLVKKENPPSLTLTIDPERIETENIQCFVNGDRNCSLELKEKGDRTELRVRSKKALQGRRTLYTITAPDKDGDWHWYSKLWVRPEKPE